MATLGEALHACIAFDWLNPDMPKRGDGIAQILTNWGVERNVDPEAVAVGVKQFREWCNQRWKPTAYYVEYPIDVTLTTGQRMKGRIDLLLKTADGWVILDHKSNPAPRSGWKEISGRFVRQLGGYRQALVLAGEKATVTSAIHFVLGQGVVEYD